VSVTISNISVPNTEEFMARRKPLDADLSPLQQEVMEVIWKLGEATADDIRLALQTKHELNDSTIRTLLRRIESKGALEHRVSGRTFFYRPRYKPSELANQAVRKVIDKFCKGSLPSLLIGMADDNMVSSDELRELAAEIERKEKERSAREKK